MYTGTAREAIQEMSDQETPGASKKPGTSPGEVSVAGRMAGMKTALPTAMLWVAIIFSGVIRPPQEVLAIGLKNVKVTFEQKGFRVANVLADDSAGWAIHPKTHMDQSATFETAIPLSLKGRTRLTFTLKHAAIANFNLGRFRLSVTSDARVGPASKWTQLAPVSATSAGGATLTITADNSILAGGRNPDHDTYTVAARTSLGLITGFRLEVLADASLPETGPGRDSRAAPGTKGNFVLTSFKVDMPAGVEKGARTKLREAQRRRRTALSAKVGAEEIIFTVREKSRDGHWYANIAWACFDPGEKYYGKGGQLCRLNVGTGGMTLLLDDPQGGVRDPQMHYDGRKILFSYRKAGTECYHLYEISIDGTGLKQLTNGPYDDIEPTYLPNGNIMFCSTRCNCWVACGHYKVYTLYQCNAQGKSIRKISSNALTENTPWMLPDGRILYTRWEYVDRHQMRYQHLWTVNPDGSGSMVYYGNQFPGNVYIDAKPIPGSHKVVYSDSPGHGRADHAGVLTVVDPRGGPDNKSFAKPLDLGRKYSILQGKSYDPYPLAEDSFLFACERCIYVTDGKGDTRPIFTLPASAPARWIAQDPRPLRPRRRERGVPTRIDLAKTTARVLMADVNHGRNMKGVKRGEIKKLLVLEQLAKPANFLGWQRPITMGGPPNWGGTFTLNRIVGTVPVEPDGSAYMELPALRSLFFVALDENDISVKRMQSFVTFQPGEFTGCVGCHEKRTDTPRHREKPIILAAKRRPSRIQPIEDIPDVPDFPRDIQPILDKHCLKCHDYDKRRGGVILSGDRGPFFSHAYATLTVHRQFADARNDHGNRPPRSIGSSASPLMKKLDGRHNKVRLTPREKKMVRLWIESGAAYPGTYAACGSGMVELHDSAVGIDHREGIVRVPLPGKILHRRCFACHALPLKVDHYPKKFEKFANPQLLYNLTRPEKSLILLAPLAKQAGGYELCKSKSGKNPSGRAAGFNDIADADYQVLLAAIMNASRTLNKIKRFDMPGYRPRKEYIREMKNYGILPAGFDPATDPIDVYKLDQAYWRSLWHRPRTLHSQADVESGWRR